MHHSPLTPVELGFRWPAEWEPHAATWLAWPHNQETWPGHFDQVASPYAHFVRTLAHYEPVHILIHDKVVDQAESLVGDLENITFHRMLTNDAWIRDYGPMFLVNSDDDETAIIDWEFNAWGGKYPPWNLDNRVSGRIAACLGMRSFHPGVVLEGGSIDGNGHGLVMTTRSCLVQAGRNPADGSHAIEQQLREYCGASNLLWLAGGPMAGDDTDGHVDQLARFVSARQIVVAVEEDPNDENFEPLRANRERLADYVDRTDEPLEVIALPMPRPIVVDGQRLPASYCNFYIANDCVILPAFEDPADAVAQAILQPLFPDRNVILLPARTLVLGLGTFHCLTQQQPRVEGNLAV